MDLKFCTLIFLIYLSISNVLYIIKIFEISKTYLQISVLKKKLSVVPTILGLYLNGFSFLAGYSTLSLSVFPLPLVLLTL